MSGDGYLSGSVAAGLPVAASLCLVPVSASLRLALVAALRCLVPVASEASDCFLPLLSACEPCPFSRSPLLGFRSLLDSPPPPASLCSHLRSQPGIISFAKTPRGLFGRARQKASFSKERRQEVVFTFGLAARHFSPRSRTLGCVVFLLAPRAPMCKRSSQ